MRISIAFSALGGNPAGHEIAAFLAMIDHNEKTVTRDRAIAGTTVVDSVNLTVHYPCPLAGDDLEVTAMDSTASPSP